MPRAAVCWQKKLVRETQEKGHYLLAKDSGRVFDVQRPLCMGLLRYCFLGVALMPRLYGHFNNKSAVNEWRNCDREADDRV